MEDFLSALKDYELLIELVFTFLSLIIAAISLGLSGYVIWQTNKLAKRQAKQEREIAEQQNELQKRQIRLELFDRKLHVNNALAQIFSFARKLRTICENENVMSLDSDKLNELFELIKEDISEDEIENLMQQARFIISKDKYIHIVKVHSFFFFITCRLWEIKSDLISKNEDEKEKAKKENIETIAVYCREILESEEIVNKIMEEELNIVRIDK